MGKKLLIVFSFVVVVVALLGYGLSKSVSMTGPVIWVDKSDEGSWKTDKSTATWWDKLSKLNPLANDRHKRVVVYLSPRLEPSQVSVGRTDMPPMAYAYWKPWSNGIEVLVISIN